MKEYLTSQERHTIINSLSKEQIKAIEKYKRLKHQSNWLTYINKTEGIDYIFEKEEVYDFYDPHNPLDSPLRCSCGHPVKYLLLCRSRSTGKLVGFSIDHLVEEAHIPKNIIKQVQNTNHTIDKGADIIYSMINEGLTFPKWLWNYITKYHLTHQIPIIKRKYIKTFYDADVPLHPDDFFLLKSIYRKHRDIIVGKIIAKQQLKSERKYQYSKLKNRKKEQKKKYKASIYQRTYQKSYIKLLVRDLVAIKQVKETQAKVDAYIRAQRLAFQKQEEKKRHEQQLKEKRERTKRIELEHLRDKEAALVQEQLKRTRAKKEAKRDANRFTYQQFLVAFQNKLESVLNTPISSYLDQNSLLDLLILFILVNENKNGYIPPLAELNNSLQDYLFRYKKLKLTLQYSDPDFYNIFQVASFRLNQLFRVFARHGIIKLENNSYYLEYFT